MGCEYALSGERLARAEALQQKAKEQGFPAKNCQYCHVFSVRENKVTRFQQYADTAQLQDVQGVRLAGTKAATS